ncbi:MAG: gamma-glutamyl-gamma-aminobutyrate hydrolase family protein [Eubacterium sp.]
MSVVAIPQMGNDLFRKYMKSKYTQSLKRSGADVKWIELNDTEKAVEEALRCDAMLLPGGADVNPALYGQKAEEKCGSPNWLRDAAEPEMLKAFLNEKKPVFAICRGIQILNVSFGGTLLQDIKDKQQCRHMDFLSRAGSIHSVAVEKNTKLFDIFQSDCEKVNSMHHQAIDKVGKGLIVSARSTDGYVEALELANYPFCMGVQWHPEHMSRKNEKQQKLFDVFVQNCR